MKRSRRIWIALLFMILLLALLPGLVVRGQEFGSNWTATLFPSEDLSGAGVTVAGVAQINYNFDINPPNINGTTITNCPNSANCADHFSIRFTGTHNFQAATYTFTVSSDDGIRLIIDGQTVINQFIGRVLTTNTYTQAMTAGFHNITVEYFEGIDKSVVQVQWDAGGVVATGTPVFTAVPALTVQVSGVKGLSLRTGPYLGASLISVVRPGTSYSPIARNRDEGTYNWFLITVNDKTGWASGRYLQVTGDPNSVPIQGTIFEQLDGAPDTGVRAAPRSVMNFRRRPSQRATLLGQIAWGENLQLLNRTIQAGNNHWFQVRYNGQVGWIYAPFVSVIGNINDVPIR